MGTAVIASYIFCILLSSGFWYLQKSSVLKQKHLFIVIALIGFFCRIAFVFATPKYYAPDEEAHFKYLVFLAEHKELPVQTSCVGDDSNDWEFYQPPLYYAMLAPAYVMGKLCLKNEENLFRIIRLVNVFLWLLVVLLVVGLIKRYKIEDETIQIVILCLVCLLPTYTFLSAMINNDNLIVFFSYAIWYLIPVKHLNLKNEFLLGITLGLAMLTKLSIIIYFPVLFVLLITHNLYLKRSLRTTFNGLLLLTGIPLLLWIPIGIRNFYLYGDVTALCVGNRPAAWVSLATAALSTLGYVGRTFWAASGIDNNIYSYFPFAGFFVAVIAGTGLLLKILKNKKTVQLNECVSKGYALVFSVAIVLNLIFVFRFNFLYAMGQGRHLFITLFPLSVFLGIGLGHFKIRNLKIYVFSFFITFTIAFTIYSIYSFPKV